MTSTQTRKPFGQFGMAAGTSNNEHTRQSNKAIGSGFGNGGSAWNPDIWSNSTIGSGTKSTLQENGRTQNDPFAVSPGAEAITGSRSLLPSSESDDRESRNVPWQPADNTSPVRSKAHSHHTNTSPMRRQKSNQYVSQPFAETSAGNGPYFSMAQPSTSVSSRPSQTSFPEPATRDLLPTDMLETTDLNQYSRHNSDDDNRYVSRNGAFGNNDAGLAIQSGHSLANNNASGYNSSVASRSGSLPPSRSDVSQSARGFQNDIQYSRYGPSSSSQRSNASSIAPQSMIQPGSSGQRIGEPLIPTQLEGLSTQFDQLQMGRDAMPPSYNSQRPSPYTSQNGFNNNNNYHQDPVGGALENWTGEEETGHGVHGVTDQFSPTGSGSVSLNSSQNPYRNVNFLPQYSHSPTNSDARLSHHSPFYSTASTPPTFHQQPSTGRATSNGAPNGQAAMLDRKLRGLQQQQQGYMMPQINPNTLQFRNQVPHLYDFQSQNTFRMNPLHTYYPMPPAPHLLAAPQIPRGPARDHDLAGHLRSALLEEFRNNSKTNKRYELKDIYDHIVEFSGDQHGSRFIQQKLETANSDEKDQVFRELHPNARQLMTDVFGNYVIQKFFEHGNQSQKKMLANQMKNHVLTLSTQMYGCRVVQKALEHILTDQQAQLVKELENDVLRCVKDQNGNHVVQKAIERVPAEHIQIIINAFTGQVQGLATHPYGCRVIQRMLEHCEEPTRTALLQELHQCAASLINDQYGNYVTQHVIEHGRDEDRGKIVSLITQNLVNFSKHKFASNVVEKSIQFGSKDERQDIVRTLTAVNDRGDSPVQILIRDQYGNYVVQKLLTELKGLEWDEFAELVKAQIVLLKRFQYGKQIAAVEKLLYTLPLPPHIHTPSSLPPAVNTSAAQTPSLGTKGAQTPDSVSHASTYASSIDPSSESRKSSGGNAIGVLTPTSTQS